MPKKAFLLSIVFFLFLGRPSSAFFREKADELQEYVKLEIEKQASAALGREVSIGSLSGNLITSVTLTDVKVARDKKISQGTVLSVRKATVSYNALRGILTKDMLQSLTSIHLEGPDVYVEHGTDGSWNYEKLIPMEEGGSAPMPVFRARITVSDGRALFVDKKGFAAPLQENFEMAFRQLNGAANFSRTDRIGFRFSAISQEGPVKVDGTFFFSDSRTNLKLVAENILLERWNPYLAIPVAKDIPMSGPADVDLLLSSMPDLKLKANVRIKNGHIYQRPASGNMSLALDKGRFDLSLANAVFCSGGISGDFSADFSSRKTSLSGKFDLLRTDMSELVLHTPGISGRAGGRVVIKGEADDIDISGKFSFSEGRIFGQDMEGLSAAAGIKQGEITVDHVRAYSGQREVSVRGRAGKDGLFAFETQVRGFQLQNPDLFNGTYALIESFDGRMSGRLDSETIKHPFRNIEAEGILLLSSGRVGSQRINRAQGKIKLSEGVFVSEGFSVVLESGGLLLSGSIGIDSPSDFTVIGKNLDLSDFKIIDDFLPEGAKGVSGTGDITISVGGYISESSSFAEAVSTLDISLEAFALGATIGIKDIRIAKLSALWEKNALLLKELYIETPDSRFQASGMMSGSGEMTGQFGGNVLLSELSPFVQRYAKVIGRISFDGKISGTAAEPDISCDFSASGINYNNISFDLLSGTAIYRGGAFHIKDPAVLVLGDDSYNIYARLSFDKDGPVYSGGVYTQKGDLVSLSSIAKNAYKEFGRRKESSDGRGEPVLVFPDIRGAEHSAGGYRLVGPDNGFLSKWALVSQKKPDDLQEDGFVEALMEMTAEARLKLSAEFSGDPGYFAASVTFEAGKGAISSYTFDSLSGSVVVDGSKVRFDDLAVKKWPGILSASGSVDLSGPLYMSVTSKDFNVAGIDKVLGLGIPVEGVVDLDATVSGTYFDPVIECVLSGEDAGIGDISIDRLDADISYGEGQLSIRRMGMNAGRQSASIEGVIPFVKDKEISLSLDLNGDNIGLLASLIKGVRWDSGAGAARLRASGTLDRPKINGLLSIKKAVVNIDQIKTTIYGFDAELSFEGTSLLINSFSGTLSGDRTDGQPLPFSLAGYIDHSETFGGKKKTEVDIAVADTSGYIDLPGVYSGDFSLSGCRLKGPFVLPGGSASPGNMLVKAAVALKDGSIVMPGGGGGDSPKPNIEFDVSAAIGRNMRLLQGSSDQVISMDVANINLQIFGEELLISGTMTDPVVTGVVEIKSGSLSILGREFDVVNEYEQERYFGSDRSEIVKNEAVFQGGKLYSAIPYIRLTAKSEILSYYRSRAETYPDGTVSSPAVQKDTTIIITRIAGMPYVDDMQRMMRPRFYAYKLDTSRSPAEPVPASYDDNQIRVMLLPDFLKSSLGVAEGDVQEGIDANAILVDYLNARLQSYLFRRLTSRVEDALGLESFTLDYNFGRDLEKLLPTKRGEYGVNDTPQFGVGFVKGIFDNVFIQVRYAQALEQASYISNMSLNYQITWKATSLYSLVYYREPITFQEQDSTYYKMTIQSQYSF